MDPITHTLTGITFYNTGFKRKFSLVVILISSIAPDFDYITRLWGIDVFLRYHRGITHGILALFFVPLVISILFSSKKDFIYFYILSVSSYALHLFMDLTNQYGTRILSPFDWQQYSLDLSFIIDPYITLGLLVSVILCKKFKKRTVTIAIITLVLIPLYFSSKYYLNLKAKEFLKENIEANTYKVCPLPNDFLRWWFIVRSDDTFKTGFVDLFTQRVYISDIYYKNGEDPYIIKSKETRLVKNFLYFAQYPFAEVKKQGESVVVIWRELSYSFRAGDHFVAKVVYDSEGNKLGEYFKF
jgi:inner membrane protein